MHTANSKAKHPSFHCNERTFILYIRAVLVTWRRTAGQAQVFVPEYNRFRYTRRDIYVLISNNLTGTIGFIKQRKSPFAYNKHHGLKTYGSTIHDLGTR
jgi:hypothetical protein